MPAPPSCFQAPPAGLAVFEDSPARSMLTPAEKQFALLAFSSLFSVINPISAAPIFVAMMADFPERRRGAAPGSARRDRAAGDGRPNVGVRAGERGKACRPRDVSGRIAGLHLRRDSHRDGKAEKAEKSNGALTPRPGRDPEARAFDLAPAVG